MKEITLEKRLGKWAIGLIGIYLITVPYLLSRKYDISDFFKREDVRAATPITPVSILHDLDGDGDLDIYNIDEYGIKRLSILQDNGEYEDFGIIALSKKWDILKHKRGEEAEKEYEAWRSTIENSLEEVRVTFK